MTVGLYVCDRRQASYITFDQGKGYILPCLEQHSFETTSLRTVYRRSIFLSPSDAEVYLSMGRRPTKAIYFLVDDYYLDERYVFDLLIFQPIYEQWYATVCLCVCVRVGLGMYMCWWWQRWDNLNHLQVTIFYIDRKCMWRVGTQCNLGDGEHDLIIQKL